MQSNDGVERFYRAGVARLSRLASNLWVGAMRAHRCVSCALIDIDEKLEITWQLAPEKRADFECAGFCRDDAWMLKVGPAEVIGSSGGSGRGASPQRGLEAALAGLQISLLLGEAFDVALELTGCRDCARFLVMKYIERAGDVTRKHIPEGGGRQGFRRACKRCRTDVEGLV